MLQSLGKFLGGLLIGFGLGMVISQNLIFSTFQYLLILILSLILGGFVLAFSLKRSEKKKIKNIPLSLENHQEVEKNNRNEFSDNEN